MGFVLNVLDFLGGSKMDEKATFKFQITMDKGLLARVDHQARQLGVSRSAFINVVMAQKVYELEAKEKGFNELLEKGKK